MSTSYSIQELENGSYEVWKRLFRAYYAPEELLEDRLARIWEFLISPQYPTTIGLGVFCADELVGFAHCMLSPCTYSGKMSCYLQDLYTKPEHRGKGLARRMIDHIAETGRIKGWRMVHWKTRPENPARKLYDQVAVLDPYVHYQLQLG